MVLGALGILPWCPMTATPAMLSGEERAGWGFLAGSVLRDLEP